MVEYTSLAQLNYIYIIIYIYICLIIMRYSIYMLIHVNTSYRNTCQYRSYDIQQESTGSNKANLTCFGMVYTSFGPV